MIKMKFHWEKENGDTGCFSVTASTVEECIKIANEEIENSDLELVDWYLI
jgi:hypothetical protein